jgi:tetratricopeptide (TPR) repeat protein
MSINFAFILFGFCLILHPISIPALENKVSDQVNLQTNSIKTESNSLDELYSRLKDNRGDKDLLSELEKIIELEKNPLITVSILKKRVAELTMPEEKGLISEQIAEFEELLGNFDEAQRYYRLAAECFTDQRRYKLLIESSKILAELGMFEEANAVIEGIISSSYSKAIIDSAKQLKLLILLNSGDSESAREIGRAHV